MKKRGIIITLPRNDEVTEYLAQYSLNIENEAIERGINFKKIKDKDVNKKEFEEIIKKLDYKMIIFNGHGSDETIEGDGETIIKCGENESLLTERIVYARVCSSAAVLGEECTKSFKDGCYIGYDRPFQFYVDNKWVANPLKDNYARLFLEPSNNVAISIIKGNTAIDAHNNSKKQILKNIKKILRNKSEDSFLIAEALWNNYEGQVVLGNSMATL